MIIYTKIELEGVAFTGELRIMSDSFLTMRVENISASEMMHIYDLGISAERLPMSNFWSLCLNRKLIKNIYIWEENE